MTGQLRDRGGGATVTAGEPRGPRARGTCILCAGLDTVPILSLGALPVFCNVLWEDQETAGAAASAPIDLALCRDCGLISNLSFDPELARYGAGYENSLHGSAVFQGFATELVDRLKEDHDLDGGLVIEVGAGRGEFLDLLCAATGATGRGFDPSYDGGQDDGARPRVESGTLGTGDAIPADLVVCRHVLEHVDDPVGFLTEIRERTGAPLYVEVPDADHMVDETGVWDVIYEHCSYFTDQSLRATLARAGYHVRTSGRAFGDQFLWAEAVPSGGPGGVIEPPSGLPALEARASHFGERSRQAIDGWTRRLRTLAEAGPVVVWGAGSKGITFALLVGSETLDPTLVDINPLKHGRWVAGGYFTVAGPGSLLASGPRHVLVMNPQYVEEVSTELEALGLDCTVLVA